MCGQQRDRFISRQRGHRLLAHAERVDQLMDEPRGKRLRRIPDPHARVSPNGRPLHGAVHALDHQPTADGHLVGPQVSSPCVEIMGTTTEGDPVPRPSSALFAALATVAALGVLPASTTAAAPAAGQWSATASQAGPTPAAAGTVVVSIPRATVVRVKKGRMAEAWTNSGVAPAVSDQVHSDGAGTDGAPGRTPGWCPPFFSAPPAGRLAGPSSALDAGRTPARLARFAARRTVR